MHSNQLSWKDYILLMISLFLFSAAAYATVADLPYIDIVAICLFGCTMIGLVRRRLRVRIPDPEESKAYIELQQKLEENKKISDLRLQLLTAKAAERSRERDTLQHKYDDSLLEIERLNKEMDKLQRKKTEIPKEVSQSI
jgi:hypothetical protein